VKRLVIFLFSAVIIIRCQKSNNCTPAKYNYNYSENKKIDTVRLGGYLLSTQINPGTGIVFSYSFRSESCPNRIDGLSSEHLVFEIPPNTANFDYSTADIQNIHCYYESSAGDGSSNDAIKIIQGTITGNKISENNWSVEVNIITPVRSVPLSFTKQFSLQ
jgi:hypothetical protein